MNQKHLLVDYVQSPQVSTRMHAHVHGFDNFHWENILSTFLLKPVSLFAIMDRCSDSFVDNLMWRLKALGAPKARCDRLGLLCR